MIVVIDIPFSFHEQQTGHMGPSYNAVAGLLLPGKSLTGRTSMVPNRTDGNFEATWIASFKSRTLIRKNPPSCSFVSAKGPSVTGQLPVSDFHTHGCLDGFQCLHAEEMTALLQHLAVRHGLFHNGIELALGHGVHFLLFVATQKQIFHGSDPPI